MLLLTGCAGPGSILGSSAPASAGAHARPGHQAKPTAKPTPVHKKFPTGPPLQIESIAPFTGSTVGVAMPISIVFAKPVAASARKRLEAHLHLTSTTTVVGAWHWFSDRRVDFRPRGFWKPGTVVRLAARLDHIGDGNGEFGTHTFRTTFTIGADVRTHVYVRRHLTVVTENGHVLRSMPSDAGSPQWPSWDGTMAVVEKLPTVRMTSCSVGIACNKSNPNYYDITLPWDVRLTWSGTFVHYSTGDPYPGHSIGTHGCVHLSFADAKWFYELSKPGDPVLITGSPRGKASGDNGYADFNLPWAQWLAGSTNGQDTVS
jgi:lipoprotein-anchoring transpeptidase ErfK/SrfK